MYQLDVEVGLRLRSDKTRHRSCKGFVKVQGKHKNFVAKVPGRGERGSQEITKLGGLTSKARPVLGGAEFRIRE